MSRRKFIRGSVLQTEECSASVAATAIRNFLEAEPDIAPDIYANLQTASTELYRLDGVDPPSAPDGTGFGESGSGRGGDNAEQGSAADVPDRDGGGTSAASADMESFLKAFGTEGGGGSEKKRKKKGGVSGKKAKQKHDSDEKKPKKSKKDRSKKKSAD